MRWATSGSFNRRRRRRGFAPLKFFGALGPEPELHDGVFAQVKEAAPLQLHPMKILRAIAAPRVAAFHVAPAGDAVALSALLARRGLSEPLESISAGAVLGHGRCDGTHVKLAEIGVSDNGAHEIFRQPKAPTRVGGAGDFALQFAGHIKYVFNIIFLTNAALAKRAVLFHAPAPHAGDERGARLGGGRNHFCRASPVAAAARVCRPPRAAAGRGTA